MKMDTCSQLALACGGCWYCHWCKEMESESSRSLWPQHPHITHPRVGLAATIKENEIKKGGCVVASRDDETAATLHGCLITTGGGFSNFATRPAWQSKAVEKYLTGGPSLPPAALWNRTGRAYPDVSIVGYNYSVWAGGTWLHLDGTSASAPVW